MSAVFTPTRHKLSVDDYHTLGEAGILDADGYSQTTELRPGAVVSPLTLPAVEIEVAAIVG